MKLSNIKLLKSIVYVIDPIEFLGVCVCVCMYSIPRQFQLVE